MPNPYYSSRLLSPAQYWVRGTNHLAPRYAISSIPPLPRPSYTLPLINVLNRSFRLNRLYVCISTSDSILILVNNKNEGFTENKTLEFCQSSLLEDTTFTEVQACVSTALAITVQV